MAQQDRAESIGWAMASLGTALVGQIVGMTLLGWLMDRWLGTLPVFLIIGVLAGLGGGGYSFLRNANRLSEKMARASNHKYRSKNDLSTNKKVAEADVARPDLPRWSRSGTGGRGWFARDEAEVDADEPDPELRFPPGFDEDDLDELKQRFRAVDEDETDGDGRDGPA